MVLLELDEQCIEGFEVLGGGLGVEIEDGGEGEAEEEVVCCAAGEFGGLEVAELEEVGFGDIRVTGALEDRSPSPLDERVVLEANR